MNKRVIAIIGLGMASEPHARALRDLQERVEVRWAHSRSEARCRQFAQRFAFPVTTDLDRILADEEIEAVLLLTPPHTHLVLGAACLEAGKHVLVEKPVAINTHRAEELVALAAANRRNLGVVLQHRFRANSCLLKAMMDEGRLGTLCAATCRVPWWRNQAYYDEPGRGTLARDGGGVLITQAIHVLDLFRSLVGELHVVGSVSATTPQHDMEAEDFAAAVLRTDAGVPASLMATTAAYPGFAERIELIGSRATAVMEGAVLTIHGQDGSEQVHDAGWAPTNPDDPMDFPYDAHLALIRDFLDALDERRPPLVTAADALRTHRLIDAILGGPG